MCFSKDDVFLAVTSSNPTIHIFKLDNAVVDNNNCKLEQEHGAPPLSPTKRNTIHQSATCEASSSSSPPRSSPVDESDKDALATSNSGETGTDYNSYYSLNSWIGWAKSTIVPILPSNISESLTGTNRAFATIRMPYKDVRSIVAVTTSYTEEGPEGRVIVGAYDGLIYIYKFKKDVGGECELLKQIEAVGK